MKIEKINDAKLKITLTITDLREQNIDIADLSLDTPKAHSFFDDVLEQAFDEYGFEVNDSPIVIEASPVSKDTLVIFISKVDKETVIDRLKEHSDRLGEAQNAVKKRAPKRKVKSDVLIFSSETLTNIELACARLSGFFEGHSMLYKLNDTYYLILGKNKVKGVTYSSIEGLLSEFLSKCKSSMISLAYIEEYGDVLIKNRTVEIMSDYSS